MVLKELLFFSLLALAGASELYLQPNGNDTLSCRSLNESCQTFERLTQVWGASDIINISPGSYYINGIFIAQPSVTIKGGPGVNLSCNSSDLNGFAITRPYVTVQDVTISGCSKAVQIGAVPNVTIANSTFTKNSVSITVFSGSFFSLLNSTITTLASNYTANGPIQLTGATNAQIISSRFIDSFVSSSLGAATSIYITNSFNVKVSGCKFSNNTGYLASALVGTGELVGLVVEDSEFSTNIDLSDTQLGAAINIQSNNNSVLIRRCVFKNNGVGQMASGGAVYAHNALLTLEACTFASNLADMGGAVSAEASYLNVTNSMFYANIASGTGFGGAIYVSDTYVSSFTSVFDNNSAYSGGAVYVVGMSSLTDMYSNFTKNSAVASGGALSLTSSSDFSLSLFGTSFASNSADSGGAVYLYEVNGTAIVSGCTYTENSAEYGGAIAMLNTSLVEEASRYISNLAKSNGGATYTMGPSLLSTNQSYYFNNVADVGGAIYMPQGSYTDAGSTFTSNRATSSGAALHLQNLQNSTSFSGSVFFSNSAQTGGAVCLDSSTVEFANCSFAMNTAKEGGAVYFMNSSLTLTSSRFVSNSAALSGGAIGGVNSTLNGTSSSFITNQAVQNGGAVSLKSVPSTLKLCSFTLNTGVFGGAIFSDSNASLDSSFFGSNYANVSGGAFYSKTDVSAVLTSTNSTFDGNWCSQSGGAIGLDTTRLQVDKSLFTSNSADINSGGAVYTKNSQVDIASSIFTKNSGKLGAGISVENSVVRQLTNSSFSKNRASVSAGAISWRASQGSMYGCTIVENSALSGGGMGILKEITNNDATQGGGLAVYGSEGHILQSTISFNRANQGGGLYVSSIFNVTSCTILNNTAYGGVGDGIFLASTEAEFGFRVTSTRLSNTSPIKFCCGASSDTTLSGINDQICNYPACKEDCGGDSTHGCMCTQNLVQPCNCTEPNVLGLFCNIYDQCKNSSFCAESTTCLRGVGLYNFTCTPFNGADPCETNNGNCDYHTKCSLLNGFVQCSACPPGFTGSGQSGCKAQCGDGTCDKNIGEQCVSCPSDCDNVYQNQSCSQCGDSYCDSGETCSSCAEDCGMCITPTCPGKPVCSDRGTCNMGTCTCADSWDGPVCDQKNTAFSTSFKGADPGVTLTSTKATFTVSITAIREVDVRGETIYSVDLSSRNYTFSPLNNTDTSNGSFPRGPCNDCDLSDYIHSSAGGSSNKKYRMRTTFENHAYLEIWQFNEDTTITFANVPTKFSPNTVKFAVQIRNWPFQDAGNSLVLVLGSHASAKASCVESNDANNIQWLTLKVNGLALYGQFMSKVISDGLIRNIVFKLSSDNSVQAILPHFYVNAVMDPSYSVLVAPKSSDNCHAKSHGNRAVKIAVPIVIILVLAVVVAVVLLYYRARVRSWVNRKMHRSRLVEKGDASTNSEVELKSMQSQ